MRSLHDIRLKSNAYMASMDIQMENSLDKVEQKVTNLNRKQLLSSQDNKGAPLVNTKTGSTKLSSAYAKKTGKVTPNLKLKGNFQFDMFTDFRVFKKQYFTQSSDSKQGFLNAMYKGLFGIASKNRDKAKAITGKAILTDYIKTVWSKV